MICYLLELQVDAASPATWLFPADCSPATLAGEQVDETRLAFNPLRPETHHAIKLCLLGMSERLRWEAIGQQTGCSDLRRGLDLTVPRALSKAKESNLRRGTLSMVWQGAQGKGKPKGKGKGKGRFCFYKSTSTSSAPAAELGPEPAPAQPEGAAAGPATSSPEEAAPGADTQRVELLLSEDNFPCLFGYRSAPGIPRSILRALPDKLWFSWQGGPEGQPVTYRARGRERVVYDAGDDLVLKLCEFSQGPEMRFARAFGKLIAPVRWQEYTWIRLFDSDADDSSSHMLYVDCQEESLQAVEVLTARGAHWAFKFMSSGRPEASRANLDLLPPQSPSSPAMPSPRCEGPRSATSSPVCRPRPRLRRPSSPGSPTRCVGQRLYDEGMCLIQRRKDFVEKVVALDKEGLQRKAKELLALGSRLHESRGSLGRLGGWRLCQEQRLPGRACRTQGSPRRRRPSQTPSSSRISNGSSETLEVTQLPAQPVCERTEEAPRARARAAGAASGASTEAYNELEVLRQKLGLLSLGADLLRRKLQEAKEAKQGQLPAESVQAVSPIRVGHERRLSGKPQSQRENENASLLQSPLAVQVAYLPLQASCSDGQLRSPIRGPEPELSENPATMVHRSRSAGSPLLTPSHQAPMLGSPAHGQGPWRMLNAANMANVGTKSLSTPPSPVAPMMSPPMSVCITNTIQVGRDTPPITQRLIMQPKVVHSVRLHPTGYEPSEQPKVDKVDSKFRASL
eukprot:s1021_g12.t1